MKSSHKFIVVAAGLVVVAIVYNYLPHGQVNEVASPGVEVVRGLSVAAAPSRAAARVPATAPSPSAAPPPAPAPYVEQVARLSGLFDGLDVEGPGFEDSYAKCTYSTCEIKRYQRQGQQSQDFNPTMLHIQSKQFSAAAAPTGYEVNNLFFGWDNSKNTYMAVVTFSRLTDGPRSQADSND